MSVAVMSLVWGRSKHKGSALLLMLYLADCANDDGGSVFPSVSRMAAHTRLTDRNVQYLLKHLIDSKELTEVGVSKLGTRQYRVNIELVQSFHPCAIQRSNPPSIGVQNGDAGFHPIHHDPKTDPPVIRQRRTQFPKDFVLTAEMRAYAKAEYVSDPEGEFENFKLYHLAHGTRHIDWVKAWQFWARRAHSFKNGHTGVNREYAEMERNERKQNQEHAR